MWILTTKLYLKCQKKKPLSTHRFIIYQIFYLLIYRKHPISDLKRNRMYRQNSIPEVQLKQPSSCSKQYKFECERQFPGRFLTACFPFSAFKTT